VLSGKEPGDSFVDYVGELETFAQEVISFLERLGVRNPR